MNYVWVKNMGVMSSLSAEHPEVITWLLETIRMNWSSVTKHWRETR